MYSGWVSSCACESAMWRKTTWRGDMLATLAGGAAGAGPEGGDCLAHAELSTPRATNENAQSAFIGTSRAMLTREIDRIERPRSPGAA